ncbi:MAG TPA: MazG nucleotide pyrophosphohydrolase domain-containing protein, partial [Gemmatimonadaceae bacterium]
EPWEKIKARLRESIAEGLPPGLPALHRAHRLQERAAGVGFDWDDTEGPARKVEEELHEVRELLPAPTGARASRTADPALEGELGDLLFAVVNLCRRAGVHPALALDRANEKFVRRFERVEQLAADRGVAMGEAGLEKLDALWDEVKAEEASRADAT